MMTRSDLFPSLSENEVQCSPVQPSVHFGPNQCGAARLSSDCYSFTVHHSTEQHWHVVDLLLTSAFKPNTMTPSAGTEAEHIDRVSNYLFYSQTAGFGNVFDFDKGTSRAKVRTGSLPP